MKKTKTEILTVFQWIWQSYIQNTLVPLALISLIFIDFYFSAQRWSRLETTSYLKESANTQLNTLAQEESLIIDKQLESISNATLLYAQETKEALAENADLSSQDSDRLTYSEGGAYYTTHNTPTDSAALYYTGYYPIDSAEREKVAKLLTLQGLMKNIVTTQDLAAQIYFNSWDSLNIIYPYFDVLDQYSEQLDITEFNFYYEADANHNPQRGVVWTDSYLDPAGQGWMISAVAPVYSGDFLEGVVGIDMTVQTIANQILKQEIPWEGYGMLIGKDGTILALPTQGEIDLKLTELSDASYDIAIRQDTFKPEYFNLYNRQEFLDVSSEMKNTQSGSGQVVLNDKPQLISWSTIEDTDWKLLIIVPEEKIYAQTILINHALFQVGVFMVSGLIILYAIFFIVLSRRSYAMSKVISYSLNEINQLLEHVGKGHYYQSEPEMPVSELKQTTHKLIEMGEKLGLSNERLITAQNELQRNEYNLQSLVNAIDDIILQIDENGSIIQVWSTRHPAIGDFFKGNEYSICSILTPGSHSQCMSKIRRVLETGKPETIEFSIDIHSSQFWYQARISKISNLENMLVISARDITSRIFMEMSLKSAKEEAIYANQAKSDFLSNMSHELRTPLNAILGFSQLMQINSEEPLTPTQDEYVSEIIKAGDHLLELINEVLDLSKIESGRYSISVEPVEVIELIDEIVTLMNPLATQRGISLTFDHDELPTLITVTDRTRLKQILINLISNGIKYNRQYGRVHIAIEKDNHTLRFHVTDNGFGIPEDQHENIFTPFHRLPEFSSAVEGTGIGLTVVKQLSKLIDGEIYLDSTTGEGSHFWLEIPFTEKELFSDPKEEDKKSLHFLFNQACKILYIEDNPANLKLMDSALKKVLNLELFLADNGEDGLEIAQKERPDLVVLDIHMPGMDGYEVLRHLKTNPETFQIPIVAISASAMQEDIDKALLMGFEDYFTKPVDIPYFLERIFEILSQSANKS